MLARSLKNLELRRTLSSSLSASKTDRSRQPSLLLHVCRVQVPAGTKLNQVQAVATSLCFSVHVPMGAYRSSKCHARPKRVGKTCRPRLCRQLDFS